MRKERNLGIELLRIVSMFAIVILHVLGQGGILSSLESGSQRYEVCWFLEILCYFGVTTYALISGFVGYEGNYRVTNIVYIHCQVLFYTVLTTSAFAVFVPGTVNRNTLLTALFPVSKGAYWYYSAYFMVFFMMPVVNLALRQLGDKLLNILLVFTIVFCSIVPVFFTEDVFFLHEGYSFGWLLAAYFIGGYLKKKDLLQKVKSGNLILIFFLCVALTWGFKFVMEKSIGFGGDRLTAYNSPTILLASVALVVLFSKLELKGPAAKVVKRVAPLTFGVYLLNCQPLLWDYLMKDRFAAFGQMPAWKILLCTVLTAMVIFLSGIAVDGVRFIIYELGRFKQKLNVLNEYMMKDFCPCCGQTKVGKFEICEKCGWENDPVQLADPSFAGGANKESLNAYKEAYMKDNHDDL